ncbi:MAG: DUF6152 family protein [Rhodospirillaceae bacterium]|nr:DUF6152 family protein [Rhodospirillaceae bacterium]
MPIRIMAVLAAALVSGIAPAHHGGSMYERESGLTIENAQVIAFFFVNPHARLIFSRTDGNGDVEEWEGELSGANELVRSGIYADLVEPGARVTLTGRRHLSEPRNVRLSSIVLPDGRELRLP